MFLQRSGSKACNSGIDTCCLCPWMQQDDTCHWTALPFLRECQISGGKQWICAVIWHCCGSIRLNCFQSSVILSSLWCCCECQEVSTPHFAALQVPIMFQWTITFVSLRLFLNPVLSSLEVDCFNLLFPTCPASLVTQRKHQGCCCLGDLHALCWGRSCSCRTGYSSLCFDTYPLLML